MFADTSTSPPWTPLDLGSALEQQAIQYIHKFYCKDCQMDQQAAERARAAAAGGSSSGAASTTTATVTTNATAVTMATSQGAGVGLGEDSQLGGYSEMSSDVKQEPQSPMSPQQMTDEASLMITLDKNKECK